MGFLRLRSDVVLAALSTMASISLPLYFCSNSVLMGGRIDWSYRDFASKPPFRLLYIACTAGIIMEQDGNP
jgi:hypothetical protein